LASGGFVAGAAPAAAGTARDSAQALMMIRRVIMRTSNGFRERDFICSSVGRPDGADPVV
jgi:hypothetical protein